MPSLAPKRTLVLKLAFDWAAVWHKDQHRKYPGALVPYMSHVAGVASILSRHGVMEDCGVTHDELRTKFGVRVADLVRHVSEEDKSLSWEERKRRYLEHFSEKPWDAQAITLADKIDNFQSIIVCSQSFGDPWKMFKRGRDIQIARFRELEARASRLPSHPLIAEYARTLADLDAV